MKRTRQGSDAKGNESPTDDRFDEAVAAVLDSGYASASYILWRLKIGYARAARMIDSMEEASVIGPKRSSPPRKILVTEWPPAKRPKPKGK